MKAFIRKASKAIAGGVATLATGAGTMYVVVPDGAQAPFWVNALVLLVNAFIGFTIVYRSPANR